MNSDGRMKGIVRKIIVHKNFGFILVNDIEYFFHRDDCEDWDTLIELEEPIRVSFVEVPSKKGPRASNVTIEDNPH